MDPFSRFSHYFLEVARSGSLRKASEILYVSASAINRQILQAEADMGVLLFERLSSGLKLTIAGEMLYNDLQRWTREYRRTQERFDELQGLRRGQVSVALIQALNDGILATTLADIARDCPWLTVSLAVHDSQIISQRVREADVDIGLLLDPEGHQGLEVRAFAEFPLGVVLPPGHILSTCETLSLGQLSDERHILPGEPLVVQGRVSMLYKRHSLKMDDAITCNDIRLIKSLIRSGTGISLLSLLDVMLEVQRGELCFVPLRGVPVRPLTLALCVAPARQLSRAALMTIQRLSAAVEVLGSEINLI